ncbi:unnamed protein product [Clonostachys solani]|uniref:Uncharacterized protein n=1 Tax=Clonostachys solani TaxID=160281 RepID=A0A9P0EIF8_9HYPO|nr:unnamed protein product [Clonostachys solani]
MGTMGTQVCTQTLETDGRAGPAKLFLEKGDAVNARPTRWANNATAAGFCGTGAAPNLSNHGNVEMVRSRKQGAPERRKTPSPWKGSNWVFPVQY